MQLRGVLFRILQLKLCIGRARARTHLVATVTAHETLRLVPEIRAIYHGAGTCLGSRKGPPNKTSVILLGSPLSEMWNSQWTSMSLLYPVGSESDVRNRVQKLGVFSKTAAGSRQPTRKPSYMAILKYHQFGTSPSYFMRNKHPS